MANSHETLTSLFTDIANAIRAKTGKTGTIVADNFPSAISGIKDFFSSGTSWGVATGYSTQSGVQANGGADCDGNTWVVGSYHGLYYSTDTGITWQASNITTNVSGVKYANGIWVASNPYSGDGVIYYSTDGITWNTSPSVYKVSRFYYENGRWFAGWPNSATSAHFITSTDGINWTKAHSTNGAMISLQYGNGMYCALFRGSVYYSTNGTYWYQSNIPEAATDYNGQLKYSNGLWVAATPTGIWYSSSGTSWTQTSITSTKLSQIETDGEVWIVAGLFEGKPTFYRSTDGVTWTKMTLEDNNMVPRIGDGQNCIKYVNGIWLAVCRQAAYSLDQGQSWIIVPTSRESFSFGLYFCKGRLIWCAHDNIYYS